MSSTGFTRKKSKRNSKSRLLLAKKKEKKIPFHALNTVDPWRLSSTKEEMDFVCDAWGWPYFETYLHLHWIERVHTRNSFECKM